MPRLRFWTALFAVLILQLGLHTYELASPFEQDQRIARITWKAATRLTGYDIHQKTTPQVRRSPMVGELMEAHGVYYYESPIVWIDEGETLTQVWLTIFHEQIHYIQELNGVEGDGYDKPYTCLIEYEAMHYTNMYADELGASRPYRREIENWRELYNCKPKQQIMKH